MTTEVVSTFFCEKPLVLENENKEVEDLSTEFLHLIDDLNNKLEIFQFPAAIKCIYNPTIYARHTFEMYVRKYCNTKKSIMFFGMNPGPFGMSQTGVPFGDVSSVREWLGIEGPVGKPPKELETRPVRGFECTRTEISGKRFWGLLKEICGTPEKFFESSFVYNYLNQQWMKTNGCNLTPGDFKVTEMKALYEICDPIFIKVLELYNVQTIIAVGKFCETRAHKAIEAYLPSKGKTIKVLYLPHPSPRTVNNNNWDEKALEYLERYDLLKYYKD
ncbi:PREDICTED: single-strand selective monofunctional uracil DNA glycosylase [Papilio xuthus]|uniref:Single-strand selective monofunctional uracil DNA glycosylase n=1 Tax=Papilio xuthus TaxID=66420 RepID=A0AAJ6ZF29_PAPXU|nr:PREDICTED: single-strand selective monofunctional uracil DNA glycosylase [Papilio xuthus]